MGKGSSKAGNKMTMTRETLFDGLEPKTNKKGDVTLLSVSRDGNKIAVVLDRNSLIEQYDDNGRSFYLSVGDNKAVPLEDWQVSATGNTVDAKAAHARIVIIDKSTFDKPTVDMNTPSNTRGTFQTYKNTATLQSKAQGDDYGMGFSSGFDDNDNPTRFTPVFKASQYGNSRRKKKK